MTLFGLLAFLNWNHDWNNWHFPDSAVKKAIEQIRELGVDTVRTDIVWSDVYAGPDQYNFERYDRLISQLTGAGLNLLVLLHYNKIRVDSDGREIWNRPPASFEEFARYVETTVRRYKHQIHAWEIWNEPNHPDYWAAPADGLRSYCRLLSLSYAAAKNVDPSSLVLNGGITGDVVRDVESFYSNGGGAVTDKLNIHAFVDPTLANSLQSLECTLAGVRGVLNRHGDAAKKIWITEIGCPGMSIPQAVSPWWVGPNTTEQEQADWLERVYEMAKGEQAIEQVFWAFYRDTGGVFNSGVDYFGLVNNDFAPKPAFIRMKTLISNRA